MYQLLSLTFPKVLSMSEKIKSKCRILSAFCYVVALGILGYTLFSLITYTGDIERLISDVKINGVGLGLAYLAAVLTGQT